MADKLRIARVEDVQVSSGGEVSTVTLHLTAHHLILVQYTTPSLPQSHKQAQHVKQATRESWFAYPMIASCIFRPVPHGSTLKPSIRLRGRDFKFLMFIFEDDKEARDVYESIKGVTCHLGSISKLYAFHYDSPPSEKKIRGWEFYDARAEWKRQGISDKSSDSGWRISQINTDYSFSPTYPALLPVPASISDNTLNHAGRYRSRVRIPVLTYLHPITKCSITRSSQPLAGLRGNRSIQDEKLVYACFSALRAKDARESECETNTIVDTYITSKQANLRSKNSGTSVTNPSDEDNAAFSSVVEAAAQRLQPYGSQNHNLIVDARPTVNALAMQAVGLGSENMDHYKFASKIYLGIDNIHVMRDSLGKVIEAIKDSDISKLPPNRERLAKSGWLKHITCLLEGSSLIALQVGVKNSNVLIHCSDGWDRTSQLSAITQILLEPYYRTIDGFIVLVEKDWLAFGHMFQHRSGFLNCEKWFSIQNDALAGSVIQPGCSSEGRGDAIENALLSAKRFFNKSNHSQENAGEYDCDIQGIEEPTSKKSGRNGPIPNEATKPRETSPVFHQFLDATYQILYQHPTRFEFNERFLRRLLYHLYSCQYGTFLYNNEKSRLDARIRDRTASVWDYFLSRRSEFTNKNYDSSICDDRVKGKERLILPQSSKVRWWHEVFNRSDVDMNGPTCEDSEQNSLNNSDYISADIIANKDGTALVSQNATKGAWLPNSGTNHLIGIQEGISSLGLGVGKGLSGSRCSNDKQPVEIEMC
ncbi:Phosphoinositide 3-phosphatase [Golovinomyces cichoracearum]|uniref:Phosphoinositide 3-phosphatase n=1 Tax=Golovinomyces cichoracearum TaxID=62708 RepID=A0A420IF70_9PEZI|nr:Phosphoinositide 3-phosphatase [Golovinomyces cichoracearum]